MKVELYFSYSKDGVEYNMDVDQFEIPTTNFGIPVESLLEWIAYVLEEKGDENLMVCFDINNEKGNSDEKVDYAACDGTCGAVDDGCARS